MTPEMKRIKKFLKEFDLSLMVCKKDDKLVVQISGKYGKIWGLFDSPQDLSDFIYDIRRRWRSKYYEVEFEDVKRVRSPGL